FGNTYNFGYPVVDDYHTFTIEWAPDEIHWYVDGINFHNATPADVAPNTWVYNHPFYIILNAAIGGNFGGPVAPGLTFPRDMYVDYVRVYQAVDTAERFEATFDDNFTGWRKLTAPFADFTRSADQPAGAPDDGFGLTEVWGYGFKTPNAAGAFYLDQVQRAVVVEDSVPVSTPGCYDFPNTGAQICFDDTGSLTQVDVILRHQYPTGQLAALPLPRQYEITGIEGRAPFSATVYLPYSDADLTDGIIEDDLQLYRYLGGGAWQAYPSTVDTATNIVSAGGVAEFSIWAIGTAANPPSVVALTSLESQGRPGIWAAASMLVVALAISGGIWRRRRA
ncbi:MAG: family 16 glycosylhydrolase, partial [Anaerolineae bacterium]|nr:family 16 glycosylhydrolase [Anaerolineae bacterium]